MDIGRRDQLAALLLVLLLIALVAGLVLRRSWVEQGEPQHRAHQARDAVQFDRFSAHRERSEEGDRLSVSLRLRTSESVSLPCFVFVIARNDQVMPKVWAVWPPQPSGPAITAGGHFHGATPSAGQAVTLSDQWERITAILPQPSSGESFDTVVVYLVDPSGRILLERPFKV
jgi:hypothetical protein